MDPVSEGMANKNTGVNDQLCSEPKCLFHEGWRRKVSGKGVYTSIITLRSSLTSSSSLAAAAVAGPSSALQAGLSVRFTVPSVL